MHMRRTYTAGAAARARPVTRLHTNHGYTYDRCCGTSPASSTRYITIRTRRRMVRQNALCPQPAHAVTHLPQGRTRWRSPALWALEEWPCRVGAVDGAAADLWCLPKAADLAAAEPPRGTTGTSRARHCTRMCMYPGGKVSTCMSSGTLRVAHGRAPLHLLHLSTLADARRRNAPPHAGVAFVAAPQLATLASWGGLPRRLTVHALGAARGSSGWAAEDPMSGCGAVVMRAARCYAVDHPGTFLD